MQPGRREVLHRGVLERGSILVVGELQNKTAAVDGDEAVIAPLSTEGEHGRVDPVLAGRDCPGDVMKCLELRREGHR